MSYEMTTSVRFCLSYDRLKVDFNSFKIGNILRRKHIADMDVVNEVTCKRKSIITNVVIRFL